MKEQVRRLVIQAVAACFADNTLSSGEIPPVVVEVPAQEGHGDYATNAALSLARPEKKSPRAIAQALVDHIPESSLLERVEIAGPGFINFFLKGSAWQETLSLIEEQGAGFGRSAQGGGKRVQVEFVSANPTGPLHIGHGRGAAIGDTLCRLLDATGWDVTREFYYNDAGAQITNLALSVQARCLGVESDDPRWPADGYQGEYIRELARAYLARETVEADARQVTATGDIDDLESIRLFAVASLRREQDQDLTAFDVRFDLYSLESELYTSGRVEAVVRRLMENNHTYEQDGALWLKSTDFGDDKDRVMRKADGSYTYFVPDVAYHLGKWERGFVRVVNEQGADHHSTITRVRAGLQAVDAGIPLGWPEYLLHQMVTVMRGGGRGEDLQAGRKLRDLAGAHR